MPVDYASQYTPVLLAGAFGFVIVAALLFLNRLLAPRRPEQNKGLTYECGMLPIGRDWAQYHVRYYLYAILFLIFDVEVLFLLPFAAAFNILSPGALLAMLVFIFLLAEGLVWAWHRGHLEWK